MRAGGTTTRERVGTTTRERVGTTTRERVGTTTRERVGTRTLVGRPPAKSGMHRRIGSIAKKHAHGPPA